MKAEDIQKIETVADSFLKLMKAIFKIFGIDEPDFDFTADGVSGGNYGDIKDALKAIAGVFSK